MQPLLRIQSIPINIEVSTKRAALRYAPELPGANVTRSRGKAEIRTEPARIQMDSYEMRASIGLKSAARLNQEHAQEGVNAANEATRQYAETGSQLRDNLVNGDSIAGVVAPKLMTTTETALAFLPSARTEMYAEGGTISFDYSMDKLTFDWNTQSRLQLEFEPGSIDFTIAQYPDLIIEYLGSPIYAPPSANPDYEPPLPVLNATA